METIKSAEEILKDKVFKLSNLGGFELETIEAMIEFAKLHVTAALKEASATDIVSGRSYKHRAEHDKDSILNSYSLENIK